MLLRSHTGVRQLNGEAEQNNKYIMYCVYILISVCYPNRCYVGITEDIARRLSEHNKGDSVYTKKYAPWVLRSYIAFENKKRAEAFEKYLKNGSGFSFLKKRLI